MSAVDLKRRQVSGRGIPVTGNDIDTDRIIPARFLKAVTFEGMGEHAFEDAKKQNPEHPFNQKAYQGASVLVVGQNSRARRCWSWVRTSGVAPLASTPRKPSCAGASEPS